MSINLIFTISSGKIAITEPATSPYLCTAGEFVNIRCLNPVPDEVEWVTPDGRTLTADVDKFVINQSVTSETVSFFTIEGMTPEYAGIYTCRSVADHNNMEVITLVMAEEPGNIKCVFGHTDNRVLHTLGDHTFGRFYIVRYNYLLVALYRPIYMYAAGGVLFQKRYR